VFREQCALLAPDPEHSREAGSLPRCRIVTYSPSMEGEPVLDILRMRKVYRGKVEALRGVSLQVPRGCVFGLLGPNGAGKSTLVKILTTIIRPTECGGSMLGHPIGDKSTLQRVGYLPEHARFPSYLTGEQVVHYCAGLAGVPHAVARKRMEVLLARVKMSHWGKRRVTSYSKGMKQRIGIAQALINDPEIVFLDEPTDGVDPEGRSEIREMIGELREEGRTVFINTHLLAELEQVADRVGILSKGELVREGLLRELMAVKRQYEIRIDGGIPPDLAEGLRADKVTVEGARILIDAAGPEPVQPVIDALRARQIVIRSVEEQRLSLEELYFDAVRGAQEGGAL